MNPHFLTDCAWNAFAIIRRKLYHSSIPPTPEAVSDLCARCFRIERRFLERPARRIVRLPELADFPEEQRWEVTIMGHRPYRVTYHPGYHFCTFDPACPAPFQQKLQDELYKHIADLRYGLTPLAKAA
jgi:hypothetical protein